MPRRCRGASSRHSCGADRRDRARPSARRRCRTGLAASASPPITSRRSSGMATSLSRASRRSSTKRTRAGPSLSKRRSRPTSSPTTTPHGRHQQPAGSARQRRRSTAGCRSALQYAYARAPRPYTTKRMLRVLGLLRLRWLRPSYSSLDDMMGLARDLARAGEPVLNLLFHSSEAIVGGSPYNRTARRARRLLRSARAVSSRLRRKISAPRPATFAEFRAHVLRVSVLTACISFTSRRTCRRIKPPTPCCRGSSVVGGRRRQHRRIRRASAACRPAGDAARARRHGFRAGPTTASSVGRCASARSRAARRIHRALEPAIDRADVVHVHSNGLLAELAVLLSRRRDKPVVLTLYGTEIWHYAPKRVRAGSLHARVSGGVGGDVLQRTPARPRARAGPDAPRACRPSIPPVGAQFTLARRGGAGRRPASRSASPTATCS